MTPVLYYDATCPICTNYKRFIERRLGDRITCLPAEDGAKDVTYKVAEGQTYSGTRAIDRLLEDFPEVQDLNFLLPEGLRKAGVRLPGKVPATGMKAVYKVSGVVRKAYQTVRKGCNCGGGKRK